LLEKFAGFAKIKQKCHVEEDLNRAVPAKNKIKRIGFYAGLFLGGFLLAAFAGEGIDAFKKTANLAGQTAAEAWSPSAGQKVIAKIPLGNGTNQAKGSGGAKKSKLSTSSGTTGGGQVKSGTGAPTPANISDKNIPTTATNSAVTAQSSASAQISASSSEQIPASPSPTAPVPSPQTLSPAQTAPVPVSGHLVIAEVQISGTDGDNAKDFIRIANPNSQAIDISGWKLRKRTRTGTESSVRLIPDGTSIPPGGTILWANNKIASQIGAQIFSSANISANNSVAIFDGNGNIIDAVAWGSGSGQFAEGSPYSANPGDGQILKRKIQNGTWQDTNNNAADFSV
jgi:hypothetical protein